MAKDDRDILEVLQEELDFIEKGGYGRSVRAPWSPKSSFQDSLSCLNYGYPYRAHPCNECRLLDLLRLNTSRKRFLHFIPLDKAGTTVEDSGSERQSSEVGRSAQRLVANEGQRDQATARESQTTGL